MKVSFPATLILIVLTALPALSFAQWRFGIFGSGSVEQWFATSGKSRNKSLEIFCSRRDRRPALALYLEDQEYSKRDKITLNIQVDEQRIWQLTATRHAMAITVPDSPTELLQQLSAGNSVQLRFDHSENQTKSFQFALRGSARALKALTECN